MMASLSGDPHKINSVVGPGVLVWNNQINRSSLLSVDDYLLFLPFQRPLFVSYCHHGVSTRRNSLNCEWRGRQPLMLDRGEKGMFEDQNIGRHLTVYIAPDFIFSGSRRNPITILPREMVLVK